MLQEWASPADQVLAMRRIRGDKHATIAAMHRAVDAVSPVASPSHVLLCYSWSILLRSSGILCFQKGESVALTVMLLSLHCSEHPGCWLCVFELLTARTNLQMH